MGIVCHGRRTAQKGFSRGDKGRRSEFSDIFLSVVVVPRSSLFAGQRQLIVVLYPFKVESLSYFHRIPAVHPHPSPKMLMPWSDGSRRKIHEVVGPMPKMVHVTFDWPFEQCPSPPTVM